MLDIKFVRENPEIVKQNIRNKFQDKKLVLVDEVLELDKRNREIKAEVEALRANKNKVSKEIGKLMGQGKRKEAMAIKEEIAKQGARVDELTEEEKQRARIWLYKRKTVAKFCNGKRRNQRGNG